MGDEGFFLWIPEVVIWEQLLWITPLMRWTHSCPNFDQTTPILSSHVTNSWSIWSNVIGIQDGVVYDGSNPARKAHSPKSVSSNTGPWNCDYMQRWRRKTLPGKCFIQVRHFCYVSPLLQCETWAIRMIRMAFHFLSNQWFDPRCRWTKTGVGRRNSSLQNWNRLYVPIAITFRCLRYVREIDFMWHYS